MLVEVFSSIKTASALCFCQNAHIYRLELAQIHIEFHKSDSRIFSPPNEVKQFHVYQYEFFFALIKLKRYRFLIISIINQA